MKNIPNKIFLNLGEDLEDFEDFNELGEVTWCADKVGDGDIEYTRKPIWHDLRKNPDDLPEVNVPVLVKTRVGIICSYGNAVCWYGYNNNNKNYEWKFTGHKNKLDVLAWMEIPEFK